MRINIYGPIFSGFCEDIDGCTFSGDLASKIADTQEDIELFVNSPGGEIEGMVEIASALHEWSKKGFSLTVTVEGLAASAAGYLLLNLPDGAVIRAYSNSAIMYHGASLLIEGGEGALHDAANYLRGQNEAFREALERTDIPAEMITDCLKDGRSLWLTGKQALEYGIVDEIIGGIAPEITETESPKYRAVALFYPKHENEGTNMKKKNAKALENEELKEEIKEEIIEEKQEEKPAEIPAEEVKEVVKEVVEETTTEPEADCGEEKPVADLEKTIEELTKRIEVLEQKLLETEAEKEQESAKVEALSGGLRAVAKVDETKATAETFRDAYNDYRKAHPELSAAQAFMACAKENPELHRASIYKQSF